MSTLFEKMLLGTLTESDITKPIQEAGEPVPAQQPPQQPPPQPEQDPGTMVAPVAAPPDFTGGGADPNAAPGMDPNAGSVPPPMDPNMGGGDPNAAAAGAPMDPNAAGGMDPNAAPQDPNADPNAGAPDAAGGDGMQPPGDGLDTSPNADIEDAEKTIFSDLKPEQMMLKNTELKERYQELYKAVTDSLGKINKISRTTYDDNMLDFIVKKMTNLRTMIKDSLVNAYPSRTYLENKVELQRFAYSFNYLTNMMTVVYQSRMKRQQAITKMNNHDGKTRDPEEFPIFNRGYDVQ